MAVGVLRKCLYLLAVLQLGAGPLVGVSSERPGGRSVAAAVTQLSRRTLIKSTCRCRRCRRLGFCLWLGRIPWRGTWSVHLSSFPWKIPWTEEAGGLQSPGVTDSDTTERPSVYTHTVVTQNSNT